MREELKRWTPKEIELLRTIIGDRYPYGHVTRLILPEAAKILGRTEYAIRKKITSSGIKKECKQKVVDYYMNHTSIETAEKYNMSVPGVEKLISRTCDRPKKTQYTPRRMFLLLRHYYLIEETYLMFLLNHKAKLFEQSRTASSIFGFGLKFVTGLEFNDYFDLFGREAEIYFKTNMKVGSNRRNVCVVPWLTINPDIIPEIKDDILILQRMQKFIYNIKEDNNPSHIKVTTILSEIRNGTFHTDNTLKIGSVKIKNKISEGREAFERIIAFRNKKQGGKIDPNRSAYTKHLNL